ncbi:Integrase catalytic domain-containing protein, partial [Aphis craccivora]
MIEIDISNKIKEVIRNCVPCILMNRKQGKQEGLLNCIRQRRIAIVNLAYTCYILFTVDRSPQISHTYY